MGMEGKLRQVSEFELAAYRKNPEKFYSELTSKFTSGGLDYITSAVNQMQESPAFKGIRERALAGLPILPEDQAELRRQQDEILGENKEAFHELQSEMMGLSKDGLRLSLYKDWHRLHYLLTVKCWEPADSPLCWAIMGGTELPDRAGVKG